MKCSQCGAELVDLFTSVNVCTNKCNKKKSYFDPQDLVIGGMYCFCDELGSILTKNTHSIRIDRDDMVAILDGIRCIIINRVHLIFHSKELTFEYSPTRLSLCITQNKYGRFHILYGRNISRLIDFFENGNKLDRVGTP